jgi:hypothetical protein
MSQYPLRLPKDLHEEVKAIANEQGVSINQFLLYAISSKVGEVKASREYFQKRTAGLTKEHAAQNIREFLKLVPNVPPQPGDELP